MADHSAPPHWLIWDLATPFLGVLELARMRTVSGAMNATLKCDAATYDAAIKREFGIARIARCAGSISLHYSPTHVVSFPLPPSACPQSILTHLGPLLLGRKPREHDSAA